MKIARRVVWWVLAGCWAALGYRVLSDPGALALLWKTMLALAFCMLLGTALGNLTERRQEVESPNIWWQIEEWRVERIDAARRVELWTARRRPLLPPGR